jgi:hypothetical protein
VLARLRLLEREREVAVVLRAAEISKLAEAQPEDPVDRGVGELDVGAAGHGRGDGRWHRARRGRAVGDAISDGQDTDSWRNRAARSKGDCVQSACGGGE